MYPDQLYYADQTLIRLFLKVRIRIYSSAVVDSILSESSIVAGYIAAWDRPTYSDHPVPYQTRIRLFLKIRIRIYKSVGVDSTLSKSSIVADYIAVRDRPMYPDYPLPYADQTRIRLFLFLLPHQKVVL